MEVRTFKHSTSNQVMPTFIYHDWKGLVDFNTHTYKLLLVLEHWGLGYSVLEHWTRNLWIGLNTYKNKYKTEFIYHYPKLWKCTSNSIKKQSVWRNYPFLDSYFQINFVSIYLYLRAKMLVSSLCLTRRKCEHRW